MSTNVRIRNGFHLFLFILKGIPNRMQLTLLVV